MHFWIKWVEIEILSLVIEYQPQPTCITRCSVIFLCRKQGWTHAAPLCWQYCFNEFNFQLVCSVSKDLPPLRLHIFVEIMFITITLCWNWICRQCDSSPWDRPLMVAGTAVNKSLSRLVWSVQPRAVQINVSECFYLGVISKKIESRGLLSRRWGTIFSWPSET